jgi:hypothetical protein
VSNGVAIVVGHPRREEKDVLALQNEEGKVASVFEVYNIKYIYINIIRNAHWKKLVIFYLC